jgi:hypothetical protein
MLLVEIGWCCLCAEFLVEVVFLPLLLILLSRRCPFLSVAVVAIDIAVAVAVAIRISIGVFS